MGRTIKEAAAALGITDQKLYGIIHRRKIQTAYENGIRIPEGDFQRLMADQKKIDRLLPLREYLKRAGLSRAQFERRVRKGDLKPTKINGHVFMEDKS